MYLENMKTWKSPYAKENHSFKNGYNYWREFLFERAARLFVWDNTYEVPYKNIETTLLVNGFAGVAKNKEKKLVVYYGTMDGITDYFDEFTHFTTQSPLRADRLKIDKDVALINNDSLRNSLTHLIHRYAIMLSHTEVSLVNVLINGRANDVPTVSNDKERQAVKEFRNSLCNGNIDTILDPAFMGVEWKEVNKNAFLNIKDLWETRQNILNSFYSDIGVKTGNDKKGNMIVEEVKSNDSMLLLNINDMLRQRELGCERVNKLFGTNWTVKIAPEIADNITSEVRADED